MVLIVPCNKICPQIAPSEGRIVSPRTNRNNMCSSHCHFVGIHGNTELVAALKLLVCGNPKLKTFSCGNFSHN